VQFDVTVLCLEDKIVQQSVATVLEAICEEDFLGLPYGLRPGRARCAGRFMAASLSSLSSA
jgi:hypothetical protein